jgi:4-hydroxybenzoyl-CoA thioesterase
VSSSDAGKHLHALRVGFGDCDPAGIVYFPRFFGFFHEAMESWFDDSLGLSYASFIVEHKLGFPAVHSEADFKQPCFFGERLNIELRVTALGRRSLTLGYLVKDAEAGPPRVLGSTVCVVMDLDPVSPSHRRAVEFPDFLRVAIENFRTGSS